MGDYSANLQLLYQKPATGSSAYYVDPIVYDYATSESSFNSKLPLQSYFNDVSDVTMTYEKGADVDKQTSTIKGAKSRLFYSSVANNTATVNSCSAVTSGDAKTTVTLVTEFTSLPGNIDDVDTYDIKLTFSQITTPKQEFLLKIAKAMGERINDFGKSLSRLPSTSDNTLLTDRLAKSSHNEFNDYMNEINGIIAIVYFQETFLLFATKNGAETPAKLNETENEKQARWQNDRIRIGAIMNVLGLLSPWKFQALFNELRKVSKQTMAKMIENMEREESANFISAFSTRNDMANGSNKAYYYLFRTLFTDKFKIPKDVFYEDDAKIDYFMRKLLIEFYIKTAYPLIHYDFIDALMTRYVALGDFVNARFALLAKCVFTYRIIDYMVSQINATNIPNVPDAVKVDIATNINSYLDRNNKGTINTTKDISLGEKLKQIVIELHQLSNEVSSASYNSEMLKDAIKNNQLTMRTITDANVNRQKEADMKNIEFIILVVVLALVVVACTVLFFFDKSDIAAMIAGGFVAIILVYKAVMMIISFIRKN
jgi:hypothetical protein